MLYVTCMLLVLTTVAGSLQGEYLGLLHRQAL